MNVFDQMREAMEEARRQMRAADDSATKMAEMVVGRLSKVDSVTTLRKLKRELRDFDMTTGQWRKK